MTLILKSKIPTVKLSKNYNDDEFLNSFVYHNESYFGKLINMNITKVEQVSAKAPIFKGNDQYVGIHYETGKWKWGSVGMMNKMIRRGYITIAKDHNNDCYCLNATAKLVNKILKEIWKNI
jgi:hypothetical protein